MAYSLWKFKLNLPKLNEISPFATKINIMAFGLGQVKLNQNINAFSLGLTKVDQKKQLFLSKQN
jgi:hypothetical protein